MRPKKSDGKKPILDIGPDGTAQPIADHEPGEEAEGGDALEGSAEAADGSAEPDPLDDALDPELVDPDLALDDVAEALPIRARSTDPNESALSLRNPLDAYMRDVERYRVLSPEEQHELAVRYVEEGDVDAARQLVTSNLRLVVKIAYDYRRAYKNLLDLVQEGNIGLMQAVKKYDPYRGVKLSSYAALWIRAYMMRFILNNARLVKLGTTQAQRKLFYNLRKEKAKLAAMGIEPTADRIAARLDVPESEVVQMDRRLSAGDASLDAPVGGGEGRQLARVDLLEGGNVPIDEALADNEMTEMLTAKVREYGATLSGKEKVIFDARLLSDEPKTLQELGDEFGVTRERVRQIEKRLLEKLRRYIDTELAGQLDDVVDV